MRASLLKTQRIRVAVIETDPLRFVGLRTCLGSESDFELSATSLSEAGAQQDIDLVLLATHIGSHLFEVVATLKAARRGLRIIVMGAGMGEENILKAIASGAKGISTKPRPQMSSRRRSEWYARVRCGRRGECSLYSLSG